MITYYGIFLSSDNTECMQDSNIIIIIIIIISITIIIIIIIIIILK